eukprot:6964244-Alexandrium_andersonii.AAC.1
MAGPLSGHEAQTEIHPKTTSQAQVNAGPRSLPMVSARAVVVHLPEDHSLPQAAAAALSLVTVDGAAPITAM